MLGRMYVVTFDLTAVTAQVDLFELTPADDKPLRIHSMYLYQTTELGDAAEEILEIEFHRGGTAMTTGNGTAATVNGTRSTSAAAGAAVECLGTTLATFTSGVVLHRDGWNVRVPFAYRPTPEERLEVSQANGGMAIRTGAAPTDSVTMGGTLYFEELG